MTDWGVNITDWEVSVTDWEVSVTDWEVNVTDWEVSVTDWEVSVTDWEVSVTDWEVNVTDWEVSVTDWEVGVTDWEVSVTDWEVSVTDWEVSVTDVAPELCYILKQFRLTDPRDDPPRRLSSGRIVSVEVVRLLCSSQKQYRPQILNPNLSLWKEHADCTKKFVHCVRVYALLTVHQDGYETIGERHRPGRSTLGHWCSDGTG